MRFKWHPDEDPPEIESHSKAKLDVLRSYLRAYFDRLNVNPNREEFKLDLVDGFAGGGTFLSNGETISGTPLIMLEESKSASQRLNQGRARHLKFNCKHYFVDAEQAHTDHLRKVLTDRGYPPDDEKIVLRASRFENEVGSVIKGIQSRQQRAGRAIFLLDQTGFSKVGLRLVKRIMGELPGAEVILTFAADALINHLSEKTAFIRAVAPLELTESQIRQMIESREYDGGRALVQRTLRTHIRSVTGADFDTPFFIRPLQSRRSLWFVHLSRHPTARDVMIQRHWENLNTFQHYGPGDFGMLGWDALRDSESLPLFNFTQADSQQLHEQLLWS
ncbi:MAG: three-Cys-motif partner protein TcmP [Gammaproteobacteria bacterium]|nr:three-Cys-motif partner protein TcmP [Gammaproteobacteria bacterium]